MHIYPLNPNSIETLDRLLEIWESAVRATHSFLSEQDVRQLRPHVTEALRTVPHLYGCGGRDGPRAFLGVEDHKLEMLFVSATHRGAGIGKQLARFAIDTLQVTEVDVNEQNPQAIGFYEHMGFATYARSERDPLGNPFPLLHMRRTPGG